MRLIGATDANLSLAHDYGFIIYAMMPLALVQNTLASIIRADGSPKYAMGAMLVGAVLNIIGDPVTIFVLDWGIKGAAYATILGQFVSFLICAAYLARSRSFRISPSSFRPDPVLLKQVMALGASSFLTQLSIVVITVVNNILLVKYGAVSPYGADIPLAAFVRSRRYTPADRTRLRPRCILSGVPCKSWLRETRPSRQSPPPERLRCGVSQFPPARSARDSGVFGPCSRPPFHQNIKKLKCVELFRAFALQ